MCSAAVHVRFGPIADSCTAANSGYSITSSARASSCAGIDKGDYDRAIADLNEAIKLDPKDALAYHNRGMTYSDKSDLDRAIADHSEAIRLDPKYAPAYSGRGLAYFSKGDYGRAIVDCSEAIKLAGKYTFAYRRGIRAVAKQKGRGPASL
jgi:tetratricopeptide (TPR) repeat protein